MKFSSLLFIYLLSISSHLLYVNLSLSFLTFTGICFLRSARQHSAQSCGLHESNSQRKNGSHVARSCPVAVWHHGRLNPLFEKLVSVSQWIFLSLMLHMAENVVLLSVATVVGIFSRITSSTLICNT